MNHPSTPQPAAAKDRVIRVFVSSTLRDMIEDRNELMSQVWPALRRLGRGRAVEFVEVDLRCGITEEQAQRKETVRHCQADQTLRLLRTGSGLLVQVAGTTRLRPC